MKNKQPERSSRSWYARNDTLIHTLEEQLGALQLQQVQVQLSHHQLQLQAALVQGWCDTLLVMQKLLKLQGNSVRLEPLHAVSDLQEASKLHATPADRTAVAASAAGPTSAGKQFRAATAHPTIAAGPWWPASGLHLSCSVQTIAPLSDPTAYIRQVLARDPVPGAESMTAQQVAQVYRDTVLQSSVLLHQMPLQSSQQQQATVAELQELWDRCFHAYLSVFVCGQQCYMEQMSIMNCSTLEQDEEGSAAALANLPSLLPALGITPQQQEVMTMAYVTLLRHHKPIANERRQLQLQVAAVSSTCSMPFDESSSSCSNGSVSVLPLMLENEHRRRLQLDDQRQAVLQLDRLLRKDAFLRVASAFGVLSCLSWDQLSRWGALSWPHVVRPLYLAKALYELQAGQLQQSA